MRNRTRCVRWALQVLALLTLPACGIPHLHSHAEPADTIVHRDGRQVGQGGHEEPLPYFGTVEMAGFSTAAATTAEAPRFTVVRQYIGSPITGWLFPLDFLIEAAASVWREPPPTEMRLTLPPVSKFEDVAPPGIEDLRRKSASMRSAR